MACACFWRLLLWEAELSPGREHAPLHSQAGCEAAPLRQAQWPERWRTWALCTLEVVMRLSAFIQHISLRFSVKCLLQMSVLKVLFFKVQRDWVTQMVLNSARCMLPGTMFLYSSPSFFCLVAEENLWLVKMLQKVYRVASTSSDICQHCFWCYQKRERTWVSFWGKFPSRSYNHSFLSGGEAGLRCGEWSIPSPVECWQPAETRKSKEWDSPLRPPEGIQSCWHLDFSPDTYVGWLASRTMR